MSKITRVLCRYQEVSDAIDDFVMKLVCSNIITTIAFTLLGTSATKPDFF